MASNESKGGDGERLNELYVRHAGQFVFWAVLSLVGWSFYSTLSHETKIAVIEQRLLAVEAHMKIGPPAP